MQLCSDDVQNVFKINHHYLISWDLDDWKNVLTASQTDNSSFMEADHQIKERKCPLQATHHELAFKSFKLYKSCSVHITVFARSAHFLI